MGIGIPKKVESLQELCQSSPSFQVNKKRNICGALCVWKLSQGKSTYMEWPYKFYSDESYVFILVEDEQQIRQRNSRCMIDREKVPIQLAQMFFSAQFLKKYSKVEKNMRISQCNFSMKIYSYFGDNLEDEFEGRVKLMSLIGQLQKCLVICANSIILSFLNNAAQVDFHSKLNEYIDFEGEHYTQINKNQFIKEALFGEKTSFRQIVKMQRSKQKQNYCYERSKQNFPFVKIASKKKEKDKEMILNENQLDTSSPFACEITEINIRAKGKAQVDESNLLLKELQEQEQQPMMEQIIDRLYIGSEKSSRSYSFLDSHHIKMIINCAADTCKNWYLNDLDYQWIFFPDPYSSSIKVQDINIQCLVYGVTEVVQKYLKNKQKTCVLIHCAGVQGDNPQTGTRSVSLMLGVLMVHFGIGFQEALKIVSKKWKNNKVHPIIQSQLRELQKKLKYKNQYKEIKLYSMCSYSNYSPQHIVAKYLCDIQNVNNLQGINNYAEGVFIASSQNLVKIMTGRQCAFKDYYVEEAKKYIKLLSKYEKVPDKYSIQNIDKTFRKQQPLEVYQNLLRIDPNVKSKNPGFKTNEPIILKYPLLRPVWEKKHDDGFYFTIKEKKEGSDVILSKGINWIGYEEDKEQFLDRIISCYLKHISHDKIFIDEDDSEKSLFDMSEIEF